MLNISETVRDADIGLVSMRY